MATVGLPFRLPGTQGPHGLLRPGNAADLQWDIVPPPRHLILFDWPHSPRTTSDANAWLYNYGTSHSYLYMVTATDDFDAVRFAPRDVGGYSIIDITDSTDPTFYLSHTWGVNGPYTFSFWENSLTSGATDPYLIGTVSDADWYLQQVNSSTDSLRITHNGTTYTINRLTLRGADVWSHNVVFYDGVTLFWYVDSILQGSVAASVPPVSGSGRGQIVNIGDSALAEYAIWTQALNHSCVSALRRGIPSLCHYQFYLPKSIGSTTNIECTKGTAVYTGQTPTVTKTAHQTLKCTKGTAVYTGHTPGLTQPNKVATPTKGTAVYTGHVPTIGWSIVIEPTKGTATYTGYVPELTQPNTVATPTKGTATYTGHVPVITQPRSIAGVKGTAVYTGYVPEITQPNTVPTPTKGTAVYTGHVPGVQQPLAYTPTKGTATYTGNVPGLTQPNKVATPTKGTAVYTGYKPTITQPNTVPTPTTGTAVYTGYIPLVDQSIVLYPIKGTAVYTGFVPGLTQPNTVATPTKGTAVYTGYVPGITQPRSIAGIKGTAVYTGYVPGVVQNRVYEPIKGSIVATGFVPTVIQATPSSDVTLFPEKGTALYTGYVPTVYRQTDRVFDPSRPGETWGTGGRSGKEYKKARRLDGDGFHSFPRVKKSVRDYSEASKGGGVGPPVYFTAEEEEERIEQEKVAQEAQAVAQRPIDVEPVLSYRVPGARAPAGFLDALVKPTAKKGTVERMSEEELAEGRRQADLAAAMENQRRIREQDERDIEFIVNWMINIDDY